MINKMFFESFLAGALIAIGCIVNVKLGFPFGSIVFGFGLYSILKYGLSLFTGKIGYISSILEIPWLLLILLFNFIGAYFIGCVSNVSGLVNSEDIVNMKLNLDAGIAFWRAFLCGVMMYLAVNGWKSDVDNFKVFRVINCFLCIFIFVACGFEHCVADIAYIAMDNSIELLKTLKFITFVVLGNSIGSIFINGIFKQWRRVE